MAVIALPAVHVPDTLTQCGKRSGGTTELQHQQARLELIQALAATGDGSQPTGDFHAQGHRCCVLQPSAPGQWRGGVAFGLAGKNRGQLRQFALPLIALVAVCARPLAVWWTGGPIPPANPACAPA